ncbi:MAG: hypothetical protein A3D65_01715 [Candidatus Lloydbacteria bacterium RIFCSPHIGHO2_02_FULL_50_13]|uniref:Uncharacterized protein n=1 Tax=Candidatus Lloydbacteria bacterium RIFCSPHIGHO2_02_FULL_50_13 TaxID=1798661 RepID=A0A1G2DAS8_9BACT|nr:MAG: hypothetical protein A3D65_01715 [Candidatus Lloydbacteria bacterium RIFCSPHIGHO2_02_FULL_50_13]
MESEKPNLGRPNSELEKAAFKERLKNIDFLGGIKAGEEAVEQQDRETKTRREGAIEVSSVIPQKEVHELKEIYREYREIAKATDYDVLSLRVRLGEDSQEYHQRAKARYIREMEELEALFDSQDIWLAKFTTDYFSHASDEGLKVDEEKDSLYYVTPSGVSVRIKKSEVNEGKSARNDINEKILFMKPDGSYSSIPEMGTFVEEVWTERFEEILREGNPQIFPSLITTYVKQEKTVDFSLPPESRVRLHHGHRVNVIYFLENK